MGWTNSVPIFHDNVTFILQPEIPQVTIPYINNVPVKGPTTMYPKVIDSKVDGVVKTIAKNPSICWFVWEHFQNLNRVVQWMKYCGGIFSGPKLFFCAPEIFVLGHRCTPQG
jgi:hypothetical protein